VSLLATVYGSNVCSMAAEVANTSELPSMRQRIAPACRTNESFVAAAFDLPLGRPAPAVLCAEEAGRLGEGGAGPGAGWSVTA